ncbi:MAG: hypothetical protein IKU62_00810 [Ruminiclostridium sp.]|nr:hypothetical protein [Ruminiclostridium sp.]
MNPTFDFEARRPPVLTERMLREEADRRRVRRQTLILTLAALATQVILVVLGLILVPTQPLAALACLGYVCLSTAGGGLAALIYQKERRLAS